jgi:serine/threonine protein kinase
MFQTILRHEPFYFGIPMIVGNSFHGLMHKIGRYQVEHELGRGAMGIVYRAFDPAIGRRIAIKTIRLDELGDDQARAILRERLMREAQSAGILSHPNIVTIYDISEDENNAYIFMEYVEGATLDSFSRGIPVSELLSILEQAAEALDYAHQRGIIHRDIKPGNLMLSGTQLKITDFGIARLQHRDSTQSGSLIGTPSYMSPEQIAGGAISGAADQYALAVVAYEFLAGVKPFETDNLANLLYRITQMPVPPVARLNAATNQVLARALSKAPEHRYPNCAAFVGALEHGLGLEGPRHTPQREASGDEPTMHVSGIEVPAEPVPDLPKLVPLNLPPPPQPSRWKPVAATLFSAALIAGLLWFSFGRDTSTPVTTNVPTVENTGDKPSPMGQKLDEPVVKAEPVPEEKAPVETKPIATKPPSEPFDVESHPVAFGSNPAGAEILVNEGKQDRCPRTPCSLELPAGEYQLTAKLSGFDDLQRKLQVPSQGQVFFEFEKPQGTIIVNSTPSGASVQVNGRDTGQKTPAMLKLSPGKYTLEVVKEGLPAQSQEVNVRNGVIQTLAIQWK